MFINLKNNSLNGIHLTWVSYASFPCPWPREWSLIQGSGQLTQGIVTGPKKWSIAQESVHRPKKVVNGPRKLLLTISIVIFPLLLSFINCLLIIVLFLMLLVSIFLSFNHWFSYCLSVFLYFVCLTFFDLFN